MITLFIKKITDALIKNKNYKNFLQALGGRDFPLVVEGPKGSFISFLIAETTKLVRRQSLVLFPTEREMEEFSRDLSLTGVEYYTFPSWETLPYMEQNLQAPVLGRRALALKALLTGKPCIIVTTLRAFLSPLGDPEVLKKYFITLKKGTPINPINLEKLLTTLGYLKVPAVSVPGEFALRGEVLDLFLAGDETPVRIVYDFDLIEEIRIFEPETQRSISSLDAVDIYPSREIIWDEDRIQQISERLKSLKAPEYSKIQQELRELRTVKSEEILFPLSFSGKYSLADYFSEEALLFTLSRDRLYQNQEILEREVKELYSQSLRNGKWNPPPSLVLLDLEENLSRIRRSVDFPIFLDSKERDRVFTFPCAGARSFFGNISYLKEELTNLISSNYSVTIFAESSTQALRIEQLLKEIDLEIIPFSISEGFTLPQERIVALQENEIFGRKKRIPSSVKKAVTKPIDSFVDLSPGDFVVHISYGIGRFMGIERIKAAGTERDYIQLEYAEEETIFIPLEQVNLVQRYIGSENHTPRLDKIGGSSWEKRKHRVKKAVEDLAEMLLKLYSKRKQAAGFSFPKDSDWQIQFEAAFPYEETEDQIRCIDEVKQDMENGQPMDRLVCGDVGFGKTEIAMRAAFKAVMGGKQVAFLAPTTILVEQHYNNFKERFEKFPVKVGMISRFVSRGEQIKLLKALKQGEVDILIGTHRLLQRDVIFKNLGLVVIDEEQRFGVKDKERLKEIKTSLDCLALSATPIPRTLHMSLLKIRDMSLLTTAPHNRLPIETHLEEFTEEVVSRAVRKEIERGGQVFYLHNRIETLQDVKAFLERIMPEILVEIAHGRMSASELEERMHRFVHGGFHLLLSTTIIENGIDIPNVNTIIIDRADMYGISQLYQLKGRVGRSDRKAYAYLLYPEKRSLSELAMKRLNIISDFTDLGSGFKIALKDMEVRGAGNLLGREQHGEIASVGFDMYLRLLDEAIAEAVGGKEEEPSEIYLELEYSGFIPDSYISSSIEKMEFYKKIASIQREEDLDRITAELYDKFGPMPEEIHSLLSLAEIRILCGKLHISSLKERGGKVSVEFSKVAHLSVDKVIRLIQESGGNIRLDPYRPEVLTLKTQGIGLAEKSEFLREKLSLLV